MNKNYHINIKMINRTSNKLGSDCINKIHKGDIGQSDEVLRFRWNEQNLPIFNMKLIIKNDQHLNNNRLGLDQIKEEAIMVTWVKVLKYSRIWMG